MSLGTTTFFLDNSNAFIYWQDMDGCSALITASVTLDMYPSDGDCPVTTATVRLWMRKPNEIDALLDEHIIRAPAYTLAECDDGEGGTVPAPMRMNVALVGREMLSSWSPEDADHYNVWVEVIYASTGVDGVYTPTCDASMILGVFPCQGYAPS